MCDLNQNKKQKKQKKKQKKKILPNRRWATGTQWGSNLLWSCIIEIFVYTNIFTSFFSFCHFLIYISVKRKKVCSSRNPIIDFAIIISCLSLRRLKSVTQFNRLKCSNYWQKYPKLIFSIISSYRKYTFT